MRKAAPWLKTTLIQCAPDPVRLGRGTQQGQL